MQSAFRKIKLFHRISQPTQDHVKDKLKNTVPTTCRMHCLNGMLLVSQPTPGKRLSKQMGLICALKLQSLQALASDQVKHEIQTQGLSSRNALCSKLGVIYGSFLAALMLETLHH